MTSTLGRADHIPAASPSGSARPVSARPVSARTVRTAGIGLMLGSLTWAITLFAVGPMPDSALGTTIGDLGSLAFQLSLFGLLHVQRHTLATGPKRFWRVAFTVERVLLCVAISWTVLHAFWPDLPFLPILDLFWPLSMLGMFIIGAAILVKGRWHGALRVWPMVAESWAVVCVPMLAIFGNAVATWLPGTHLLLGYVTLGALLLAKPELTGAAGQE